MSCKLNSGAGRAFVPYTAEYSDYCERKLKHYNEWLAEGIHYEPYPGFPEDEALLEEIKKEGYK